MSIIGDVLFRIMLGLITFFGLSLVVLIGVPLLTLYLIYVVFFTTFKVVFL